MSILARVEAGEKPLLCYVAASNRRQTQSMAETQDVVALDLFNGYPYPPQGLNRGAAVAVSTLFLVFGVVNIIFMRRSGYRIAMGMAVACIFRGTAFALKAASITNQGTSQVNSIMIPFLIGAGFGIAIGIQMLTLAGWFKNTVASANLPPSGSLWRWVLIGLFPVIIMFGPVLGLAGAIETYVNPTLDSISTGNQLRKASAAGMYGILSIMLLLSIGATIAAWLRSGLKRGSKLAPHASVLAAVVSDVLLDWSGAYRVATTFVYPELAPQLTTHNETMFYCLQVLPELLQMIWYTLGPTTRLHLSSAYAEWFRTVSVGSKPGNEGMPLPMARFFDDSESPEDEEAAANGPRNAQAQPPTVEPNANMLHVAAKGA